MSTTDTSVKYFDSTMMGAPTLSNTVGSIIGVLDACLVNGFGAVDVSSLSISNGVATVTVPAGHGLTMYGDTAVGPVVAIAGASPAELNGEWRVSAVPDSNTVEFRVGLADVEATGTITMKRAAAGWGKLFSGTGKAVYERLDPEATAMVLRVDHVTSTSSPNFSMYEYMSDVDTGTGTSGILRYLYLNAARPWRLFADSRMLYLCTGTASDTTWAWVSFGDIESYRADDSYACWLRGRYSAGNEVYNYAHVTNNEYQELARNVNGVAAQTQAPVYAHGRNSGAFGSKGQTLPAPADGSIHLAQVDIWDDLYTARGILVGFYDLLHNLVAENDGLVFGAQQTKAFIVQKLNGASYPYGFAIDITGPWR